MPYPNKWGHVMSGRLPGGEYIVCGGFDSSHTIYKDCYTYSIEQNQWAKTEGTLIYNTNRGGHDSHPDWGFVVAGGEGSGISV